MQGERLCTVSFSFAKSACESVGSGLIMSNLTLFHEKNLTSFHEDSVIADRVYRSPVWVGAKEREDERGSYMFLDGSELSSDHPALPEELRMSSEAEPALCVIYWPWHGLGTMECNGHEWLQQWMNHVVCDNGQVVSLCERHECPDWSGHDWYLRSRSKPC